MTYYDAVDILTKLSSARWTPEEMPEDDAIKNAIKFVAAVRVPHGFTRDEFHAALWWMVKHETDRKPVESPEKAESPMEFITGSSPCECLPCKARRGDKK